MSLQNLEKENMRRRKTEKQRHWREKMRQGQPPDMLPAEAVQEEHSNFCNKMSKFRAVKKLKDALPQTPFKRFATMKSYLSSRKSPTVKKLQKKRIIPSPEDRKDAEMNAAVVQDVKTILSEEKLKRNDKLREVVSILTASMSGPTVEKCKAKVD
jgi:hypothetical protein